MAYDMAHKSSGAVAANNKPCIENEPANIALLVNGFNSGVGKRIQATKTARLHTEKIAYTSRPIRTCARAVGLAVEELGGRACRAGDDSARQPHATCESGEQMVPLIDRGDGSENSSK
jgi:hypothetical protein